MSDKQQLSVHLQIQQWIKSTSFADFSQEDNRAVVKFNAILKANLYYNFYAVKNCFKTRNIKHYSQKTKTKPVSTALNETSSRNK